jgi:hypothetical protein
MCIREDALRSAISRARDHAVSIYVFAFAVATICHLFDSGRGGWLPYTTYALGLNVFWTSLTLLDPWPSGRFTFWGLATQIPVGVFMWWTAPELWATESTHPPRDG